MSERHSRDSYFIVGEGMVTAEPAEDGVHHAMDVELRPFRFSRIGPMGRQLGEANRRKIGNAMTRDAGALDSTIPAGFTYLGQFVDHDLTFDKTRLKELDTVLASELVQGRSPSLDLDSLYGLGPVKDPAFYSDGSHLKVGETVPTPDSAATNKVHKGFDLPRRPDRSALIPDHRNDENLAVAQTHAAFIRFHNRVVDRLAADGVPAGQLFEKARDLVVRHYQWMLKTDYLPKIVAPPVVTDVFAKGRKVFEPNPPAGNPPTMPIEFSVAAFRLGHSMVRDAYNWNVIFDDGFGSLDLLFTFSGTSGNLGGNPRLPSNWIVDWRGMYDFSVAGRNDLKPVRAGRNKRNVARRIDTLLADPLSNLPPGSIGGPEPIAARRNLAFRNLTRARMLKLASGQQMAALMRSRGVAVKTLTDQQLANGKNGANLSALDATQRAAFLADTPLWFYVLREAEINNGRMTGVGGRIVAETFHRAMQGSAPSIVGDPAWKPTLGHKPGVFTMADLLLFAFEGKKALLNPLG